ncbi:MAG: hypothetical protein WBP85_02505 [Terracidiphilus sp.]
MATATAVQTGRNVLHVRGDWSARDDRIPSAVWLGILWIAMIAGFGVDFPGFVQQVPPPPKVIWVHAFVFTVWMFVLTAQVLMVLGDRVAWHRKFGWFAIFWASIMAVLGPWAAIASEVVRPYGPLGPPFLAVNLVDITGFLALLAWGVMLRKNPAAHRRMMILSTVALADPGFARFSIWLLPMHAPSPAVWFCHLFYGNVLLVGLMAAWDWRRGRLMRSFVIGAAALLASEVLAAFLYFWGPWHSVTTAFIAACARLHI